MLSSRCTEQEGLDHSVRKHEEQQLRDLRQQLEEHERTEKERLYAVKYHKVRFTSHACRAPAKHAISVRHEVQTRVSCTALACCGHEFGPPLAWQVEKHGLLRCRSASSSASSWSGASSRCSASWRTQSRAAQRLMHPPCRAWPSCRTICRWPPCLASLLHAACQASGSTEGARRLCATVDVVQALQDGMLRLQADLVSALIRMPYHI